MYRVNAWIPDSTGIGYWSTVVEIPDHMSRQAQSNMMRAKLREMGEFYARLQVTHNRVPIDPDQCEGHVDTDDALTSGAGIGEPVYCDGSCNPTRK